MKLQETPRKLLSEWQGSLAATWRDVLNGVELDYDDVADDVIFEN